MTTPKTHRSSLHAAAAPEMVALLDERLRMIALSPQLARTILNDWRTRTRTLLARIDGAA